MNTFLRSLFVDLMLACLCSAALMSLLGATSPKLTERERVRSSLATRTRDVLRSEVAFAEPFASREEVRRSVASVDTFVHRRAGVALTPAVAERLADLEQRTLDGRLRRVTVDEVAGVFAEVLCEKVRGLKDDEIESAADAFGNVIPVGQLDDLGDDFDTRFAVAKRLRGLPDEPAAKAVRPRNDVMLRFDAGVIMPADQFVAKVKEMRAMLMSPQMFVLVTTEGREFLAGYLGERVDRLGEAVPESWGSARASGLTPVQVLLLAYSAASDDALTRTTAQLVDSQDRHIDAYLRTAAKAHAAGYRPPYGRYGDFFSTPLDVVFDERTLDRILTDIEQRGAR